jgi:hypothetical protein
MVERYSAGAGRLGESYSMQRAKTKLDALNRLWVLVPGIAFWVIPLSILYVFGYVVGSVYLGFKSVAEKRR